MAAQGGGRAVIATVLPRDLHPGAWWIWSLGLAAAVSRMANPILIVLVVLVACFVVLARRTEAPWAMSFRFYLYLGLLIIGIRVVFRILVGGSGGGPVLFTLPSIPLPEAVRGIELLGPVTRDSLLAALYDGMRLAAIVICVGAANTLANPKRLLKSMPPALYEVGTAIVVALSVFPQLAESVQRVRRARRLRGDPGKGIGSLRRIIVPVLEDALERSMTLAAGMDARGYGRSGEATRSARLLTGTLMLAGLVGLCVGTYAYLDSTAPRALAWPMLAAGVVLAVLGFVVAGRRVERTRYRPDRWRTGELVAVASGVAVAVLTYAIAARRPDVILPSVADGPELTIAALVAVMIGLVPAFLTPPPVLDATAEVRR
ncbi:energy-coupling factor transporter transmembrane component T [Aeromicrobium wangtongii]|uniref:Energy-coupling factor transporter transmembrane protein EcfT n=1 Tax=Aeromicrobium wangtongii TaxID=2969247 RepID=A0ABY5M8D8_9ACTN|nr:energy-coupling factor transporter transmembrane component T [Aeromicrobium wangtongii]MCD9200131.1 energy-coupling factor transporter transmembrane protein EcfT [Aeromicrobium wangtongii]UUP13386.1 energy-coupling factor transporter transmembrane protein EcfT [Aeromicrobium wangtongii]